MKNKIIYLPIFILCAALFSSCEENEILPPHQTKGSSTLTLASITATTATPAASSTVGLTLKFVNPASDPIKQVVVKVKVGAADYVELQSFNEEGSAKDQEITRMLDFAVPASPGTVLVFDMVITSQREYPQVKRLSLTIQ
jgi:hypothetical protein